MKEYMYMSNFVITMRFSLRFSKLSVKGKISWREEQIKKEIMDIRLFLWG